MSDDRVAEFEQMAKLKLPADYRVFLATHSDAWAIHGRVRVAKTRLRKLFTLFSEDFTESLVQMRKRYEQRKPRGTLATGSGSRTRSGRG